MSIEIKEYKGKPVLEIQDDGAPFPLRMGLWKAKTVLNHIEDIRRFVEITEKKI